MKGWNYPPEVLEKARVAGWRLREIEPLPNLTDKASELWHAKLHLWAMEEFREVVFMEHTAVFVKPLTGPFTSHAAYPFECKVWAARAFIDGNWTGVLDDSVLGVQPSMAEYYRLVSLLASNTTLQKDAVAFYKKAFADHNNGSWCELELEKNANADVFLKQRSLLKQTQVVHFGDIKPWECSLELQPLCQLWSEEALSNSWPVTVVTAFYTGPNKYAGGSYYKWGRNFMVQNVPMVIFTDNATKIPALESRNPNMTLVVEVALDDFMTSQHTYDSRWEQQLQMDPERHIHHMFLFKVWNEKTNVVMRAIDLNPFNSSHYMWVDFGSFRNQTIWESNWTVHVDRFPTGSRLLVLATPFNNPHKRIGGGILMGNVRAWMIWSERFYNLLSLEVRSNNFVGDDQILMTKLAKKHPELFCVVKHTETQYDPWFYLQHYAAGKVPMHPPCHHSHYHGDTYKQNGQSRKPRTLLGHAVPVVHSSVGRKMWLKHV